MQEKYNVYISNYNHECETIAEHLTLHLNNDKVDSLGNCYAIPHTSKTNPSDLEFRLETIAKSDVFVLIFDRRLLEMLLDDRSPLLTEILYAERMRQTNENYKIYCISVDGAHTYKKLVPSVIELLMLEFIKNDMMDDECFMHWFNVKNTFHYVSSKFYQKDFYDEVKYGILYPLLDPELLSNEQTKLIRFHYKTLERIESMKNSLSNRYFNEREELPPMYTERMPDGKLPSILRYSEYRKSIKADEPVFYATSHLEPESIKEFTLRYKALTHIREELEAEINSYNFAKKPNYSLKLDMSDFWLGEYYPLRMQSNLTRFAPMERSVSLECKMRELSKSSEEQMVKNHEGYEIGEIHFKGFQLLEEEHPNGFNAEMIDPLDFNLSFTTFFNYDAIPSKFATFTRRLTDVSLSYIDDKDEFLYYDGVGVSITVLRYTDGTEESFAKNNFLFRSQGGVSYPLVSAKDLLPYKKLESARVLVFYAMDNSSHVWQLEKKFVFGEVEND